MLNKIYEFTLDLENNTYIPSIEFYKNDTDTSRIEITLKNDYQTLNLEGFTIVCKILKADNLEVQNIVDIVDKENGLIAINLSSQALASLGVNTIQLSIYEGLKRLSSKEFTYTVKDILVDEEGIVSQNEYTLLTQLIDSVQSVENIINTSEVTRVANEGTRIDNEGIRETQEEARQILKGQMDTLKIALDSLKTSMESLKVNVETNEATRELNEVDRELLKASMETLKSTLEALEVSLNDSEASRGLTFNSKIDAIDNKIIDVEARAAAKERLIDNKIVEVENRTVTKELLVDNKIVEANTTIANVNLAKTNTIAATTNANTKITETEATRQSIITTINNLVAQFNALAPANATNAEVQLARTDVAGKTYASLQERLLADNKQQNILYASVEGTYITSDSVDGEVNNLQILGNTYQDSSTLAIKSTGNKLSDGRFEVPLLSCGKNLFDGQLELGNLNTDGTVVVYPDRTISKNYIKVTGNKAFCLSNSLNYTISRMAVYDKNKTFIQLVSNGVTLPSNAMYYKFCLLGTSLTNNIQLEEGTVVTSFEKHQSHQITILSDEPIEKTGTIPDRIVQLSDGKWYKEKNNINIILDGSSKYPTATRTQPTDTTLFRAAFNIGGIGIKGKPVISDRFICDVATYEKELISIHSVDGYLDIVISKTKASDTTTLNSWLQQNNTLVKLPLVTPVYIPLPDDQQIALKTFATKTNILSLCEIEPTIKADVPKSTSASVNSINTRLDNVSKDLERVKKLEDATNLTVITDKDFCVIEDTSNGYLSDVKLEGRTLNQIVKNGNFANGTNGWIIGSGGTISASNNILSITGDGTVSYPNVRGGINQSYSSGKKIFIKATVKCPTGCTSVDLNWRDITNAITSKAQTITSPVVGTYLNLFGSITLPKDSTAGSIQVVFNYIDATIATGKVMEVQNVMALDLTSLGMTNYTADQINSMMNGYFEGLKSVGQDVNKLVVSSIKADGNLFDVNLLNDYITATNGSEITVDYVKLSSKTMPIKCKPNTQYTFKYKCKELIGSKNPRFTFVYSDGTFSNITTLPITSTFVEFYATSTLGKTVIGISASYSSAGGTWIIDNSSILLNEGTTPITYQPFETDKKEILYLDTVDSTWKKPVLRGKWESGKLIFGDVAEKLSDGKYRYKNGTGEVVLNGSEVVSKLAEDATYISFKIAHAESKANSILICDKFIYEVSTLKECVYKGTSDIVITILKSKLTTPDSTGFKAWLQTNPLTFVYQLLTELVYECTPIDVASFSAETNYYLESGVLSPRSTIKVQNYIGEIINNLKEKISIQENQNSLMRITLLNHEARLILHGI